jgi:outer membrane protein assembly factor BamB
VRRILIGGGLVVLLAIGVAVAFVLVRLHEGRDVTGSPTVEYTATTATPPPAPPAHAKIQWPLYGLRTDRTRAVAGLGLRPPFRRIWTFHAGSLVEFPPAIGFGRLYFSTNSGNMVAINERTGKRAWHHRIHRCVAASPAIDGDVVFEAFLNRPPCNALGGHGIDGEVIAFAVGFGRIRWRTPIGPSETSPLVANGLVYVGDWRGDVYALDEHHGKVRWRFHTGGEVKGGVALAAGKVFVGSYDGHVYALDARTGKLVWRASAQPRLGHTGRFYSTPAVAYGRVYIGATDGKVYSFGATTGKLRWSRHTGGFVYASPAVTGGLVYAGSYSHDFLAFDAATGKVRWRFHANGPISGSATVIDGVVFFATLRRKTYALDARSGKLLWTYGDGKYTPAVAIRHRLFLVGFARIYGMVER